MSSDALYEKPLQGRSAARASTSVFWTAVPSPRTGVHDAAARVRWSPRVIEMAGVRVHPMTASEIVNEIVLSALTGERLLLANHNLHSLYLHGKHEEVRALYAMADRTVIDGTPILWMASIKDPEVQTAHRVGSTDWLAELLPVAASANLRIAFLGGEPGVADHARDEILRRFPTLELHTRDGFFDATRGSAENDAVLAWIESVQPDVLLVGMGMPRQERWIAENYAELATTVVCPVGGCLDYIAGNQRLAPRWMGPLCLEWAYRLCCDPVRLWRRYLLEPQAIAFRLATRRLLVRLRR